MENLLLLVKIAPKADPIVKDLASQLDGDKLDKESKIEVAETLAIIIRQNGKSIQAAMAEQISGILEGILKNKKAQYNDKTLVNVAVAFSFLSAYSAKPQQMENLFTAFDQSVDMRLSLGAKFGILMNGNANINQEKLMKELEEYCVEQLSITSGIEEVDSEPWYNSDEPTGRLQGSLEIIAFIGDIFVRRFTSPDDKIRTSLFKVILQTKVFERINAKNELSKESMSSVLFSLASIPVALSSNNRFEDSLAQVLKHGFTFIHSFYLEFNNKKDACPAILNMLMLNYNNYLDVDDDKKIQLLTKEKAKERVNTDAFTGVLDNDQKMLAVELLFI
jgi:hypothetical protein